MGSKAFGGLHRRLKEKTAESRWFATTGQAPFGRAKAAYWKINGLLYCDLCNRYLASEEKNKVLFGDQYFHFPCYRDHLQTLFTHQVALARQMSYRESERLVSITRLLGS